MRDEHFVAEHRGGTLTRENHCKLMAWARACSEHVMELVGEDIDPRLLHALGVASAWENENLPTVEAMNASKVVHTMARETINQVLKALARSIGHAVATAHMADHSIGAALYALKAVKLAGKSVEKEREWQKNQLQYLPAEIVDIVLITIIQKEKGLKI